MRVTCCSSDLHVTHGFLGQADITLPEFGQHAAGLMKATVYVVHKFCTAHLGMPSSSKTSQPQVDLELLEALRTCAELFGADGASDEQAAGRTCKSICRKTAMV